MLESVRLLGKIAGLGPAGWRDCIRATIELALANRQLGSRTTAELLAIPAATGAGSALPAKVHDRATLIGRVAHAIPRVGAHVPWRSDCLVQAVAARRWLARSGIGSEICIGVRRPSGDGLGAHAWLKVGDTVVTGGDISGHTLLYAVQDN